MNEPAQPGAWPAASVLPAPGLAGPCPALLLSAGGRITAVNAALCQVLGQPAAALCGTAFEVWLSPASRVMMQSLVQPLLKLHGHVNELGLSLRTADSGVLEVLLYAARSSADPEAEVHVQLAPIRQRRRIEAELQRVKRAADQAPGLIYQLERDTASTPPGWRFAYANEAIRHLYGTSAEAAARSADVVFSQLWPEDHASLLVALDAAAAARAPYRVPVRVGPAGATPRWHEFSGVVRALPAGGLQWHGHVADVSDRVAMQDALIQREALERLARARSEFIGRVSHELRTPLNGILGFAQLLATDPHEALSARQAERMAVLLDSARHLRGVVEELLDISRIEAGHLQLTLSAVPVAPLLAQLAATLDAEARAHGVQVLTPPTTPPPGAACEAVLAEPQRLRQVLVNLLSNAIKYNRAGGAVWVQLVAVDGGLRIDVCDNGIGLDAQQQSGLFQPFNRVGAEQSAVPGTGLGLVISRHLVQLMGGRLTVDSAVGAGSTFGVWLPLATRGPADAALAPRPAETPTVRGRVLYAEDNAVNVLVMQAMLARCPGLQLTVAVDAAEAVAAARAEAPDLLLIDMNLPDATGVELLARLRQLPGLATVPAVVVSASAEPHLQETARLAGFDAYWTKPLDLGAMLAGIEQLLVRR